MSVVGNVYSLKNLSNISPKDVVFLFSTQNSDREGDLPGTFFFEHLAAWSQRLVGKRGYMQTTSFFKYAAAALVMPNKSF